MKWFRHAMSGARRVLGRSRIETGRAARLGFRLYGLFHYSWHLVIWSRLTAGRLRWAAVELPPPLLASKDVHRHPPRLTVERSVQAEAFGTGFAEVYALLLSNLQMPGLLSPFRHALPGPAFRGVYLWDSAFIAQIWKHWDPGVAEEVLKSVIELRDGPRLQHVVADFVRSRFTQPPLIAWSVVKLGASLPAGRRRQLYAEVYQPLCDFHFWLWEHRRHGDGLFFWDHPYESGVENAPRFSNTDESRLRDTRQQAAPDLAAYVVLQAEALAVIATALDREEEARGFVARAEAVKERVNALLWSEGDGLYFDFDYRRRELVRIPTVASLLPLWAGIPGPGRAGRLIEWIRRRDGFGTPMPVPSVARGAEAFEKDMWRGPVWLNTAYGVVRGLLRYGHDEEAGELAYRLCAHVYQVFHDERRIYEFYDPDVAHTRLLRRKKGNWWKAFTLGRGPQRDFVGWSGLVNTLMIEVLFGLEQGPGELLLRPRFPAEAQEAVWRLQWGEPECELALERRADGGYAGSLRCQGVERGFQIPPGGAWRATIGGGGE